MKTDLLVIKCSILFVLGVNLLNSLEISSDIPYISKTEFNSSKQEWDLSNLGLLENSKTDLELYIKYCEYFKKRYCMLKNYNHQENFSENFFKRMAIFYENIKVLKLQNENSNRLFEVKITHFTDMTKEEVAERLLDFNIKNYFSNYKYINKIEQQQVLSNQFLKDIHNHKKSEAFNFADTNNDRQNWSDKDWRDNDIFNEVRNQGDCGGCWAFSVVGTIEGLIGIKSGVKNYLSVQQLIDCDPLDKGCKGGWAPNTLKYIAQNGLVSEQNYPYHQKNEYCQSGVITPETVEATIDPIFLRCDEEECNEGEFQYNLLKNGPVSVVIDAYNTNFYNYKSGYYNESCAEPNHAVILVGYGFDKANNVKYWIIRNSWGTDWGMNGYGYVKYDENNYWSCNLSRYGFQPRVLN